jgi:hypothetical protein
LTRLEISDCGIMTAVLGTLVAPLLSVQLAVTVATGVTPSAWQVEMNDAASDGKKPVIAMLGPGFGRVGIVGEGRGELSLTGATKSWQTPIVHCCPALHVLPHVPQLLLELVFATQVRTEF